MMFTLFDLPNSYEIPEAERQRMFRRVEQFAKLPGNDWLNYINYHGVNLKWANGMNQENGVMGCFVFATNTIYLQPENVYESSKYSGWAELIAPTLIHELRHKWQYERNRIGYILCCLPFLREITIERDAWRITELAQEFCEELDACEDAAEYERKQAEKEKKKRGKK